MSDWSRRRHADDSVDPRDVLRLLVDRLTVQNTLASAVHSSSTSRDDIERILDSLASIGVPVAATHAELAAPEILHCVRCHQAFERLRNRLGACVIQHSQATYTQVTESGEPYQVYSCCDEPVDEDNG
jgi:hypothetical protein